MKTKVLSSFDGIDIDNNLYSKDMEKEIENITNEVKNLNKDKAEALVNDLIKLCSPSNDILSNIERIKQRMAYRKFMTMDVKEDLLSLIRELNASPERYIPIKDRFIKDYKNQKQESGISLLCPELDKRTGGLVPGTICTIVGGPGCMKTTTAINIVYRAIIQGKNICYISLEEKPHSLYSKLLSRVSVDIGRNFLVSDVLKKTLSEEDIEVLCTDVYSKLNEYKGCIHIIGSNDLASYKSTDITNKLEEVNKSIKEEYKKKNNEETNGIDIVVLDHLQILKYSEDTLDEFALLNRYVSYFRHLSLNFLNQNREIIVILLSQVNREGINYASKHDGKYLMQHLAEASEIERSSSYIITVYTDPMSQVSKLMKMYAMKLRNGALPTDSINIFADGAHYQVGEIYTPEQQNYKISDIGFDPMSNSNEAMVSFDDLFNDIV